MIPLGIKQGEKIPPCDRQSWYGKCKIEQYTGGDLLKSYSTYVAFKSKSTGKIYNLWGGWSATTGRHIRAAFGLNKREWNECEQGQIFGNNIRVGEEIPEQERWSE